MEEIARNAKIAKIAEIEKQNYHGDTKARRGSVIGRSVIGKERESQHDGGLNSGRMLSGLRDRKEKAPALGWRSLWLSIFLRLRNHIAESQVVHKHVSVLRRARCYEPGRAARIAGVIDQ